MEPTQVSLSWLEIAKLALSAGVATAAFNQSVSWLRDWHKDRRGRKLDAQYSALRLAVILEAFALECATQLAEYDMYETSGANAGTLHTTLPKLKSYPEDLDWRLLDTELAARALTLPVEISFGEQGIAFMFEATSDPDSVAQECAEKTAVYGLRAWKLAAALRSRYGFPAFERTHSGWDAIEFMTKQQNKFVLEKAHSKNTT